jgi:hypothetical protein
LRIILYEYPITVFDFKKYFIIVNDSLVQVAKKKSVKEEEMELPNEYFSDFQYFSDKHDELCIKHRNHFVAVKNQEVYSAKDPLKLLEILNENKIDPRYAVIEFIK